jgi:Lon protease-like protein
MDIVRMIQRSYYRDDVDDDVGARPEEVESRSRLSRPLLDVATGRISDLPLWRVGWVETPGRRNCLNVHEMHYTHMFERILASRSTDGDRGPMYFGHLYLPGGTSSAKSGEERYRLKTWREELADAGRFDDYDSASTLADPDVKTPAVDRSAVVGCLMQVLDHRRMDDGRLVVLVQALERFVVEEVVDTRPYAVANVQILLDEEDLPWERGGDGDDMTKTPGVRPRKRSVIRDDESKCKFLRGAAVAASFLYHEYEFDEPTLPVSGGGDDGRESYLTKDDVPWLQISSLLPFARYSADDRCLDAANGMAARGVDRATTASGNDDDDGGGGGGGSPELPVERELWNGGVLWEPPRVPSAADRRRRRRDGLDCDSLETLLWLALEDFCRGTGFVLPGEVRCLMPPGMDYLDIAARAGDDGRPGLSAKYPKRRRQRRLSYLAPALIENVALPMKGMRQVWLNAPSTAARLLGALERYEYLNDKIMGEFE